MYTSLISTDELARQLSDPALVLVDCRHNLSDVDAGQRAYGASHLPGARFMHMDRDLSGERTGGNGRHPLPDVAALSGSLSRAGIDASKQVVAYDQNNGMWASRLWWLLHWLGHDAAAVLDGGIDKWIAEGRPITADRPSVQSARFVAMTPRPVISSADILRGFVEPADDNRRARSGAFSRRYRAARSGCRAYSWRDQSALRRQPDAAANIQAGRVAARRIRCATRGRAFVVGRASMRLGRDGVPQPAGHGGRRAAGLAALSWLVERVGRRSGASSRAWHLGPVQALIHDQRRRTSGRLASTR
jgi:rhodanese-related sulfurtransferase